MDYRQPVEAVIPGATGRVLAALARVDTELPVSTLANIARVGRTRASGIIGELADLGIIERREVGRTVLVSLARSSAAGELIDSPTRRHRPCGQNARRPPQGLEVTPRRSSRRPLSPADARAYLAKSKAWLEAASESLDAGRWDVAAGSAVSAAINACDAITGTLVGHRAGWENLDAPSLLATAGDDRRYAARQLSQLLRFKIPAQYDPAPLPERDAASNWPIDSSSVLAASISGHGRDAFGNAH